LWPQIKLKFNMLKLIKSLFKQEEIDFFGAESAVQTLPLYQQMISGKGKYKKK
jgi:hypothetical protein